MRIIAPLTVRMSSKKSREQRFILKIKGVMVVSKKKTNKQEISRESIIKQVDDIVASEIDGETVMMSIENGGYYGLDPIGSSVWELIETPIKVADLIDILLKKYDVDVETCEKDVLKFLNEINGENILVLEK